MKGQIDVDVDFKQQSQSLLVFYLSISLSLRAYKNEDTGENSAENEEIDICRGIVQTAVCGGEI